MKNVQNGHFLNKSARGNVRAANRPPIPTPFASSINSLHVSVCRMSIGRRGAELHAREATCVDRILTFPTISGPNFPMLRQWEKTHFSSACHAPPDGTSVPKPPKGTRPQRHLGAVQISARYAHPSGLGRGAIEPLTRCADRQTDRQTYFLQIVI